MPGNRSSESYAGSRKIDPAPGIMRGRLRANITGHPLHAYRREARRACHDRRPWRRRRLCEPPRSEIAVMLAAGKSPQRRKFDGGDGKASCGRRVSITISRKTLTSAPARTPFGRYAPQRSASSCPIWK